MMRSLKLFTGLVLLGILSFQPEVRAHGSVTPDDDLCIIKIGYFKAHFKIHLPRARQHQEFCEDIPQAGEAVFVMEYIHGDLSTAALDFRIVRNVTGLGRFARLEDVEQIEDIDGATVFHQPPSSETDVFTVLHHFDTPGEYLGIVTATDPHTQQVYAAVFPFSVGHTRFGYIPIFIGLVFSTHFGYRLMTGGRSRRPSSTEAPA